jgi:tetratricopeptide (TPR) repeat protein
MRGNAYNGLHQHDKAIADYSKAIELDPKNAGARNALAWLLATCPEAKFWDASKAVAHAKKAVELAPRTRKTPKDLFFRKYPRRRTAGSLG